MKSVGIGVEYIRWLELAVGGDKVVHFFFGFIIMLTVQWGGFVCQSTRQRYANWPSILTALVVLLLYLLDESLQAVLPLRQFDLDDFALSAAGGILAWLLFYVGRKIYLEERIEHD
ncbi:VanZ family protein [Motilimonas cestriensis]|uniref:VanZ family protein n=1 Tax=Motilimonas cestriensis TaxID=2742685 RepID=A0ABS8W9C2_9GAMM|nr:VanZ family protein [Motilimonas cestriensis]MCE2595108.1 VanZ family protein [Motilimonas cestriensis]